MGEAIRIHVSSTETESKYTKISAKEEEKKEKNC